MKVSLLLFIALLSIFFGFSITKNMEIFQSDNVNDIVNQVVCKAERAIEKKYHIKTIGVGLAMPEGIVRQIGLSLYTRNQLTKENLRKLLVECSQELLTQININVEIQPFLRESPFTLENVEIIIFNHDKDGMNLYDPEICVARFSEGILTYKTDDPDVKYKYKNRFTETYEEALKAFQNP